MRDETPEGNHGIRPEGSPWDDTGWGSVGFAAPEEAAESRSWFAPPQAPARHAAASQPGRAQPEARATASVPAQAWQGTSDGRPPESAAYPGAAPAERARPEESAAAPRRDTGKLRSRQLIILLLMTHPPLNLIWGAIPTAYQFGGVVATPLALGIAGLTLLAFSVGYSGMARRIQHRGGLYAFITQGLGPYAGVGSSLVAMLSYTILHASLIVILAGSGSGLIAGLFHIHVSVSLCVIVGVVATIGLARLRLRHLVQVLLAVGIAQTALVLWFDLTATSQPATGRVTLEGLDPA